LDSVFEYGFSARLFYRNPTTKNLLMKKLLFFLLFGVSSSLLVAQNVRLNGYAGYVFDDKVSEFVTPNNYFEGEVKGGFLWGIGLEYLFDENTGLELLYMRQDTKAPIAYWDNGEQSREFDLAVNWIMLGGVQYLTENPKIHPYMGGMLGVALLDLSNSITGSKNSTKFAWGIRGGAVFWANEKLGIKLQANLMSAVQGVGGSFYFGTGGSGVGISSYSSLLQFGLGGGLTIKIGGAATKK
jgi:hypothetical protein